jgi:5-methylcytosine-specific restriction endonuclease McrA
MSISDATKQAVRKKAEYLCEYCHSPERLSANLFTVDHVIPRSLEGSDEITWLWPVVVAMKDATTLWPELIQRLKK